MMLRSVGRHKELQKFLNKQAVFLKKVFTTGEFCDMIRWMWGWLTSNTIRLARFKDSGAPVEALSFHPTLYLVFTNIFTEVQQ